ncbi:trehalose-phosphatase [Acinetobacter sp. WU_MDCI_Axc73]|nr:trehalose-phosphatase [Acinetobacter sp. WU_MDCI_Axc73]
MNINIHNENRRLSSSQYDRCEDVVNDIFSQNKLIALFLDIDGTLAEFKIDPSSCFISKDILHLIQHIQQYITVIAVTGRDLPSAQKMFGEIDLPIAALHGSFIYLNDQNQFSRHAQSQLFQELEIILTKDIQPYPELSLENKQHAIALHYRKCPELQQIACQMMQRLHHQHEQLRLIKGKYVYELVWNDIDKGQAIAEISHLLDLQNHLAIFIGDDRTDEDGFRYVNQMKGITIKVGEGTTIATYRFKDIDQVNFFLRFFLERLLDTAIPKHKQKYGEEHV